MLNRRAISLLRRPRATPSTICCSLLGELAVGLRSAGGEIRQMLESERLRAPVGPDLAGRHGTDSVQESLIAELLPDESRRARSEEPLDVFVRRTRRDHEDAGARSTPAQPGDHAFGGWAQGLIVEEEEVGRLFRQNLGDPDFVACFADHLDVVFLAEAKRENVAEEGRLRRNRHPDRGGGVPRLASDRGHRCEWSGPPAHVSSAVVSRSSCGASPRLFVRHPIVFARREAAKPLDVLRSRFRKREMSSMRESPHSRRGTFLNVLKSRDRWHRFSGSERAFLSGGRSCAAGAPGGN
jgi:hypothetical protein